MKSKMRRNSAGNSCSPTHTKVRKYLYLKKKEKQHFLWEKLTRIASSKLGEKNCSLSPFPGTWEKQLFSIYVCVNVSLSAPKHNGSLFRFIYIFTYWTVISDSAWKSRENISKEKDDRISKHNRIDHRPLPFRTVCQGELTRFKPEKKITY